MPRSLPKCRAKSATELDLGTELSLVYWGAPLLPGIGCKTLAELRAAWRRYGQTITEHFIRQLPGQRPFGAYASGEIPLPPVMHEGGRSDLDLVLADARFRSAWHYFGERTGIDGHYLGGAAYGEFRYLVSLRIVTPHEARLAEPTIDDRHHIPAGRQYRPLADEWIGPAKP